MTTPQKKKLTLEAWAKELFKGRIPHIVTLRRWAREARITPQPEKIGKEWFVEEGAVYQGD